MNDREPSMNDPNPTREQNSTPQPVPENSAMDDELSLPAEPRLEGRPNEKEIDLNLLFPDTETNLNDLFPDAEVKHLLKSITKNKKDMNTIKKRLTTENETSGNDSSSSDTAEDNKTD